MNTKDKRIVIAGGTGQLGALLAREAVARGYAVVVLGRSVEEGSRDGVRTVRWDGKTRGAWTRYVHEAEAVINLAGRSVNCRYTESNLREMMRSRVESTRVVGEAIAMAIRPPKVWLQMSTATIYAHRFDAANSDVPGGGVIGGEEPDVPAYWARSVDIAKAWEDELDAAETPSTRKVALRTSMVMSPDADGVFDVLATLTRRALGGAMGGGAQYVSWIHGDDFAHAVFFLIESSKLAGAVNLAAPNPLPQRDFQRALRKAMGVRVGLPAAKWMLEVGAFFMRTDTELLLKSRRVVPGRLEQAGFAFGFPEWPGAARDLVSRWRGFASPLVREGA